MFKSEKGVSAVEFALIAPLLFVLTFGIIEFSILLFDKAVVTNASREGARAAIVRAYDGTVYDPLTLAEITAVVDQYVENYLISLGGTSTAETDVEHIAPDGTAAAAIGGDVIVTVNYTYNFLVFQFLISLLGGSEFNDGIQLAGTTIMRME
ncbi:MAG: hypothetical protein VR65_23900 [Desulfobulbaceae bacterium BRH_c16a]|nr:MAG: hypothetical protein VR65_23900 [Desulfobulbaceae bacterium BRH_c16a]